MEPASFPRSWICSEDALCAGWHILAHPEQLNRPSHEAVMRHPPCGWLRPVPLSRRVLRSDRLPLRRGIADVQFSAVESSGRLRKRSGQRGVSWDGNDTLGCNNEAGLVEEGRERLHIKCTERAVIFSEYARNNRFIVFSRGNRLEWQAFRGRGIAMSNPRSGASSQTSSIQQHNIPDSASF